MATNEPTIARKPVTIVMLVIYIIVGILIVTAGTIAGIRLMAEWPAIRGQSSAPQVEPTAIIPRPTSPALPPPRGDSAAPVVAPLIPGVAQNAATAQALFDAAVKAGEQAAPAPNVGQSEPAILQSKPVERLPAGENAPTAEPVVQSGGIFGSKPAIVNVQETHECKHGQVWTESGCKNP